MEYAVVKNGSMENRINPQVLGLWLFCVCLGIGLLIAANIEATAARPAEEKQLTKKEQTQYLIRYGYLEGKHPSDPAQLRPTDAFTEAVRYFQRMTNLPETGVVDSVTSAMMQIPRCGVRDKHRTENYPGRRGRYAIEGLKWSKGTLLYNYTGPLTPDMEATQVKSEISKAFQLWSDVVPGLTFSEGSPADIEIRFVSGDHGDRNSFDDSTAEVLAHAFFPPSGKIHFNEAERWTSNTTDGRNLLYVAIHEIGHALGLVHSEGIHDSIMAPIYQNYIPDRKLHTDDIAGIRHIYMGVLKVMDTNVCQNATRDAVVLLNSSLYDFTESKFERSAMSGITADYSTGICSILPQLNETFLYCPEQHPRNSHDYMYFFKGDTDYSLYAASKCWRGCSSSDVKDCELSMIEMTEEQCQIYQISSCSVLTAHWRSTVVGLFIASLLRLHFPKEYCK